MQYENDISKLMHDKVVYNKNRLSIIATKLEGKSPLNKIGNGFAYVSDNKNKGIKSAKDISVGDEIKVSLKDGIIKSTVSNIEERL